jgi:hypothetical protein
MRRIENNDCPDPHNRLNNESDRAIDRMIWTKPAKRRQGVAGLGGILNFDSSTGALSLISLTLRVP